MKGNRTLVFALVTAIVPILSMTEVIQMIPVEYLDIYMVAVAVITALLRVITTTPIGTKG